MLNASKVTIDTIFTNTKNCPADARQFLLFHEQSVLGAVEIVSPAIESGQEKLGALLGIEPHEQNAVTIHICDECYVVLLCHAVVECQIYPAVGALNVSCVFAV